MQAAISRYRELFAYEVLCLGPQLLFPGVTAGLSALRAHGVELAVATSKTTRSAEALLDVMGIRDLVGPVVGQDMVRRGKPHPEMVLRAAMRLGVAAWQSAYVGDTVGDMRMAVTARMEPVAVTYGVGTFGELAGVMRHPDVRLLQGRGLGDRRRPAALGRQGGRPAAPPLRPVRGGRYAPVIALCAYRAPAARSLVCSRPNTSAARPPGQSSGRRGEGSPGSA